MINKAILIGSLGKDPESKYSTDGLMIVNFSIATSERYKDKSGEKVDKTEWHNITAFGKLAEICANYLHKGSKVYVEGKIKTDQWEKDGVKHYKTGIIINDMKMLDGKKADSQQGAPMEDVPF